MAMHDETERGEQPGEGERFRSTPLRPAVWMTSVLVWATVVALFLRVPTWAGVFLCVLTGTSFVVFLVAYIYLFVSDPEMLRAERYRGHKRRSSGREVERQQAWELSQDRQGYLGPEPGSVVALPDEGEPHVSVGKSSRVIDE